MAWLKLKEKEFVTGTDTGPAARAALFRFPLVSTQTVPHVTSNVADGLINDCAVILITTNAEVLSELDTTAVQVWLLDLLRLKWWVQ